jgi:hypothetical protein
MVRLPFREKKSVKSELVKLARDEKARHSKEQPSRSQGKVRSSKEALTGSKETLGESKPIHSGSWLAQKSHANVRSSVREGKISLIVGRASRREDVIAVHRNTVK